jgi:aryl-alcohol dehydrogenase-like predicted oxidoreductase
VGNTPIGWGVADDTVSIEAIKKAMDQGINFFDTADFYGLGHSESLLGKTIGSAKDVLIATKAGHRNIQNCIQLDYSRKYIVEACEASLKRLKRDSIDFYQLHTARLIHFEKEDCIGAMEDLVQQGKIRYWGLSLNTFYPEPEAGYMMRHQYGDGFQLVYNIINQRAKTVLEKAAGYGIIARMPLQFGLLTGSVNRESRFGSDDHRSFRFNKEILENALNILEKNIWPLCEKYQCSKTELAIGFILSEHPVSTVIPGMRNAAQVLANTKRNISLEEADKQFIEKCFTGGLSDVVVQMEKQG